MNSRSGYSILEVLIAFAVMSMTLAVLLPGQTQLLGRAGTASERALAHDLALSRLEAVPHLGIGPATEPYEDWRIEQVVEDLQGQRRVTVRVMSANGRVLADASRLFAVPDAE